MKKIEIVTGEVFLFHNFDNWCNTAKRKFENAGLTGREVICVDTQGRVCRSGKEFMRARDDQSFPVKVFRVIE